MSKPPRGIIGSMDAVPGYSKEYACAFCRGPSHLSPPGQRLADAGAVVICLQCAATDARVEGRLVLAPEMLAEYRRWLDRN